MRSYVTLFFLSSVGFRGLLRRICLVYALGKNLGGLDVNWKIRSSVVQEMYSMDSGDPYVNLNDAG